MWSLVSVFIWFVRLHLTGWSFAVFQTAGDARQRSGRSCTRGRGVLWRQSHSVYCKNRGRLWRRWQPVDFVLQRRQPFIWTLQHCLFFLQPFMSILVRRCLWRTGQWQFNVHQLWWWLVWHSGLSEGAGVRLCWKRPERQRSLQQQIPKVSENSHHVKDPRSDRLCVNKSRDSIACVKHAFHS